MLTQINAQQLDENIRSQLPVVIYRSFCVVFSIFISDRLAACAKKERMDRQKEEMREAVYQSEMQRWNLD